MSAPHALRRFAILAAAGLALGCQGESPEETATADGQPAVQADAVPEPKGPKKRIAVSEFGATGKFKSRYGDWDIGGGLAAQLIAALEESGHFIVVERSGLSDVLREQEMAQRNLTGGDSGPDAGRLTGAQILVRGDVTAFGPRSEGGGFSIGFGTADAGGALGLGGDTAHVGMDLRLIDTTTGQVLDTFHTEAEADSTSLAADVRVDEVSFGGDTFNKTPLGKATRRAIQRASHRIAQSASDERWQTRVAKVEAGRVYIAAGRDAGIEPGDGLVCHRVTDTITDPATGELLGRETERLGEVLVETVKAEHAIGRFLGGERPQRGDLLRWNGTQD